MLKRWAPMIASVVLLCGMTAQRFSFQPTKSAVEYHQRVKVAADALPMRFGAWIGEDQPVTADALRMLHPNVAINRKYRNMSTGLEVGLLIVQCDDARAIQDHFPPICYVTQGYAKDSIKPTDWKSGALPIAGTEYEFSRHEAGEQSAMVVDNFIVRPDGLIERDMDGAKIAAADPARRFFGAAQFQLVFPRGVTREERVAVFEAFTGVCKPVIEAVESGLTH